MCDGAGSAVQIYIMQLENPEIVWTNDLRDQAKQLLETLVHQLYSEQIRDPNYTWCLPENINAPLAKTEMVVGGVILRLFAANPSWPLRKPKFFVTELLNKVN